MSTPRQELTIAEIWERLPHLIDLKAKAKDTEWLVDDLVPAGSLVIMAGSFGSYKSTIAREIGVALATGRSFGGHEVKEPRPVLYLDRENPVSIIGNRVKEMDLDDGDFLQPYYYWSADLESVGLQIPKLGSKILTDWAAKHRGLIVFDSMVRFHHQQEKDNSAMAGVMLEFTRLARAGAAVLVIHHRGKSKEAQYRGAEDIIAAADVGYTLQRNPDESTAPRDQFVVQVEAIKNRYAVEGRRRYALHYGKWQRATDDDGNWIL